MHAGGSGLLLGGGAAASAGGQSSVVGGGGGSGAPPVASQLYMRGKAVGRFTKSGDLYGAAGGGGSGDRGVGAAAQVRQVTAPLAAYEYMAALQGGNICNPRTLPNRCHVIPCR
jgi:hypothetical protein